MKHGCTHTYTYVYMYTHTNSLGIFIKPYSNQIYITTSFQPIKSQERRWITWLPLSLLLGLVGGDKCSRVRRACVLSKIQEKSGVSIIRLDLLPRPQKLDAENKATEVLTLEASCIYTFLLPQWTINHHRHGRRR